MCDPALGCVYTPNVFCNDNNVCTNEYCDNQTGCVYTAATCPDQDVCFLGACHPVTGCEIVQRSCNASSNCSEALCDVNYTSNGRSDPCYEQSACPGSDIGLAVGLSAGIIAGIIVAALLAAALCGGGAYAAATTTMAPSGAGVLNNPIYTPTGENCDNPLYPN